MNSFKSISELLPSSQQPDISSKKRTGSESLGEVFRERLNHLNSLQNKADESTQALITGEADNIHEVLLKNEEAMLALELSVQVRNKIVEAYQEIMRMQV